MNILSILWITLALFINAIGFFSLRLFLIDKDKRKLMYSLGLFFSSISFILLGLGLVKYSSSSFIFDVLFHWGATAYIILIFHIIIQQLFSNVIKRTVIFKLFLLTSLLSLIILGSSLITLTLYGLFMGMGTVLVSALCVFLIIKEKNVSSHLFLLSIISTLISSMFLMQIDSYQGLINYFSIFAYFVSYSFIGLIFMVSPLESRSTSGIGSVFSIEKKLETTKKELSDTQETFKQLFNQLIDSVVIVDLKGIILEASDKFFFDLGITRDNAIGKNLMSMHFVDAKTKRLLLKNVFLRLTGKHIPPYEITVTHKDGTPVPYEVHAGKIKYKGKTADMAIFRDLRERKKVEKTLQETESKYQTIFEKTGTAIGTFGDDSIITMINGEFEKLTGYQKNEVEKQMHWFDFIPEDQRKEMLSYHKQRSKKQGNPPTEYDCSFIQKSGKMKQVHVNIGFISELSLRIVSIIDITPLKEMQHQLQDINRNLEQEVNKRTNEIQNLLRQKDEFIHQLGHDLKNPLGPLLNIIPILEKHENNPKYKEMLHVVGRNIQYMKNLVVKTIELAQLNSPNTHFTLIDIPLHSLVKGVIETNQFLFIGKQIDVVNNIPSDININADKLRMEELLINLLSNAVKYSHNKGSIFIDGKVSNNTLTVSIKDTGIGMTKEQIRYIFNEFYKADTSRHDFDSSGLGMPICKRIVEKHGGKIWVESEGLEKGSTISFTIPLKNKIIKPLSNEHGSIHEIRERIDALILEDNTEN